MLRKCLVVGAFAAAGAGCTPEVQLASSPPFSPEWCQAAKAFPRSGEQLYNVAMCHDRGVAGFPSDQSLIVHYLNESARWGHVEAGARLAQRGMPAPDDDLRREAAARRASERNARILADAIRPPPPPRPQHPSILFPGSPDGPNLLRPAPPRPAVGVSRPSIGVSRGNRTESVRRNCVNDVCRIERTVCVNGACRTTVSDR